MDFSVTGVIADRECKAIQLGEKIGIVTTQIDYDRTKSEALNAALDQMQPDYVVTSIHKILGQDTVHKYRGCLINLHYSKLPAFGGVIGIRPVELALEAGHNVIGTTVHRVTEQIDGGPQISQSLIPVRRDEPFSGLMDRVFQSGCLNLFNAFRIIKGEPTQTNSGKYYENMIFSPWVKTDNDWFSREFWLTLRKLNEL